ncbi:hypothetical protein RCC89_09085 [Cytophagaceae bacterium ABcell3]|nr:hypothetical protein RCC89_09085 [Cytophagaceae bacterium ABcell3]
MKLQKNYLNEQNTYPSASTDLTAYLSEDSPVKGEISVEDIFTFISAPLGA